MMYTMPKNLLSICVNFALATQRNLPKIYEFLHQKTTDFQINRIKNSP